MIYNIFKTNNIILIIFIYIFNFSNLLAHQPKLIYDSPSIKNPKIVNDPEISKAFYGKLSGDPHYYVIDSDQDFMFYAGILTPKINNKYNWISIMVFDSNNKKIFEADGKSFHWESWYEPYARDYYWKGPEIGLPTDSEFKTSFKIDSGKYFIKIYNDNNIGHYSLAIGEKEFFGSNLWEQILTWAPILFYISPYMDIMHWQKFDIKAYIPHIFIIVLLFIIYIISKKIILKKNKNT